MKNYLIIVRLSYCRALLVWMCPAMRGPRAVDATSLACNALPLVPRDAVSWSRVFPEGCVPAVRSLPGPIRCVEESVRRRHTAGLFRMPAWVHLEHVLLSARKRF